MATGGSSDDPKKDRKKRIIEDLAFIEGEMRAWGQETPEQIEADLKSYKEYRADRDRIVGKAIRAGLTEHPFVQAWLAEQRTFGEKDELRRFRSSLETGVKRPMSKEDFWAAFNAPRTGLDDEIEKTIHAALIKTLAAKTVTLEQTSQSARSVLQTRPHMTASDLLAQKEEAVRAVCDLRPEITISDAQTMVDIVQGIPNTRSEQIRRALLRKLRYSKPDTFFDMSGEELKKLANRLEKMSRQGFHKWLKKLGLIETE